MTTSKSLKVFSEIRDREIFDCDGELCGVCDDVEFEGAPGKPLRITALLVGPGAYRGRTFGWLAWLAQRVAGERITRVPWSAVEHVTGRITLNSRAEDVGLGAVERRLQRFVPKVGAL